MDGENCTLVTPARLLPLIVRDTVLPCVALVELSDTMWGGGAARTVKLSVLEVPAGDVTETVYAPGVTPYEKFTVAATSVAVAVQTCTDQSGTVVDQTQIQADLNSHEAQLSQVESSSDANNEDEINGIQAEIDTDTAELNEFNNGQVTCSINTPGHTIAGVLDKQLGMPSDELGIADDLDKIFNALGYELVTSALQSLGGNGGAQTQAGNGLLLAQEGALSQQMAARQASATAQENQIINSIPTTTSVTSGSSTSVSTPTDNTKPSITLNGVTSNPMIISVGSSFTNPTDTVTPSGNNTITSQSVAGTVDTSRAGTHLLTYTATDSSGASNSLQLLVIVDAPPTITLNGANPLNLGSGAGYIEYGANAIDALGDDISSKVVITGAPPAGSVAAGTWDVLYSVTDSYGKTNSATRVVVHD